MERNNPRLTIGEFQQVRVGVPRPCSQVLLYKEGDDTLVVGYRLGVKCAPGWVLGEGGKVDRFDLEYPEVGGRGKYWEPTHFAEISFLG